MLVKVQIQTVGTCVARRKGSKIRSCPSFQIHLLHLYTPMHGFYNEPMHRTVQTCSDLQRLAAHHASVPNSLCPVVRDLAHFDHEEISNTALTKALLVSIRVTLHDTRLQSTSIECANTRHGLSHRPASFVTWRLSIKYKVDTNKNTQTLLRIRSCVDQTVCVKQSVSSWSAASSWCYRMELGMASMKEPHIKH